MHGSARHQPTFTHLHGHFGWRGKDLKREGGREGGRQEGREG